MRKYAFLLVAAAALGCGNEDVHYNPTPQILPQNIKKIALHPILNKTNQMGLEDKLMLSVRDAFLSDGRYPLTQENIADGVVWITITRYLNVPIQFDNNLIPTSYKLRILVDLEFMDKKKPGEALWLEKNIDVTQTYAAATVTGGMTEEQARELIWPTMSQNIVSRVINGFGAITGTSRRRIEGDAPSTEPLTKPEMPLAPVNPNPY